MTTALPLPALTGRCEGCGAADGVLLPISATDFHYCPRCAQRMATADAALDHLRDLLRLTLEAWAHTWAGTHAVTDARGLMGGTLETLYEEHLASHVADAGTMVGQPSTPVLNPE